MKKKLLFTAALMAGQTAISQIPTSGLVAWFPFNNAVTDETGNSTNLVLHGDAVYVADRAGNPNSAMFFYEAVPETSIQSGYVEGLNSSLPFGSEARTIAGWYYADVMPEESHTSIFAWGAGSTDPQTLGQACAFFADKDGGQLFFWSAWNDVGQLTGFDSGQWYHFAMTFDGNTTVKFYKDGSLVGTQTLADPISTVTNGNLFRIAKSTHQNDFGVFDGYFRGALDDIGVWSRELTALEIEQIFDTQPTAAASLNKLEAHSVEIRPNPAMDQLNISAFETSIIEISDLNGKIIYTAELNGTITVDVNNWTPGVYTIRANNGQTSRFIKQ